MHAKQVAKEHEGSSHQKKLYFLGHTQAQLWPDESQLCDVLTCCLCPASHLRSCHPHHATEQSLLFWLPEKNCPLDKALLGSIKLLDGSIQDCCKSLFYTTRVNSDTVNLVNPVTLPYAKERQVTATPTSSTYDVRLTMITGLFFKL